MSAAKFTVMHFMKEKHKDNEILDIHQLHCLVNVAMI